MRKYAAGAQVLSFTASSILWLVSSGNQNIVCHSDPWVAGLRSGTVADAAHAMSCPGLPTSHLPLQSVRCDDVPPERVLYTHVWYVLDTVR